ncbi:ABC transporter substrate-binding protein [Plantactinospora endophytica]|uniref:Sulfonate ABC transporter substrate-binding protein n=1 Tax=Plantactinospora endophytica TaxID=673535 RepID=A0ABQ4DWU7_9ACTN|nr:ABC transporter substrate-binding protein [Plantactinospora endophytica]GIG86903.1 sulfonate ABC transporter substrate-binding protein [Plantactinospora endophytica]
MNRLTSRITRYASVLALLAAIAACGGPEPTAPAAADEPSRDRPVSIKVGDIEGAPASFLAFGIQKGFFTEHGLDVELVRQQGGAAIVPGLVSGDLAIGGSNAVSMLLARSRGVPVQIIAPGTSVGTDPARDFSAVIVAANSPIRTVADLAGRTVAVNTLTNVSEVVLKASLENVGADPNSIRFLELGFPEMLPAITQGRVDAALVIEPFVTIALGQGVRVLFRPYVEARPNLAVGTYSASEAYIRANPGVVRAFQQAAARTAEYVTGNPEEYRAALPSIANVRPDLAPKVNIPVWGSRVDVGSLEFFADRMVRYGLVERKPDVSAAAHL